MSEYFKVPALSNSSMKMLNLSEGGSPQKYQAYLRGDYEKKDSLSLERGSLLHLAMLEPEKFITQTVDTPSGMMGDFIKHVVDLEWQIRPDYASELVMQGMEAAKALQKKLPTDKMDAILEEAYTRSGYKIQPSTVKTNFEKPENQAYYEYLKEARDKLSVTQEDRRILNNCISSLSQHPVANRLLISADTADVQSWNEEEVYWMENVTVDLPDGSQVVVDVPCKAKLDRIRYSQSKGQFQEIDLKTTATGLYNFPYTQVKFRYYRQHAFYQRALQAFAHSKGLPFNGVKSYNVVVETNNCFEVGVYPYEQDWIAKGRAEYEEILQVYAWHQATGKWDYPQEYYQNNGYLSLPSVEPVPVTDVA